MAAELRSIPLDLFDDHPANPRILYREDVVDAICAGLNGEYPQKHAVHVRPVGNRFQLTSGHHRKRAAEKKGLPAIWAWVEPMDDEAAYMELRTSNNQGELSPLEDGIHTLKAVPEKKGGRGMKGGLREYARRIGRSIGYVAECRRAAEVYERCQNCAPERTVFLDKAKHLAAIHAADRRVWPECVAAMLASGWSAEDTKHWVGKVKDICATIEKIGAELEAVFLPREKVVARFLDSHEFSAQTVAALGAKAESVTATIRATLRENPEPTVEAFRQWLRDNMGSQAWDIRALERYERELLASLRKPDDAWHLGDWRDHVSAMSDDSVSLVLTDPPYGVEYQSDYRLDRRQERKHEGIAHDDRGGPAEVEAALLALHQKLKADAHVLCFCHWSNEADVRAALTGAGLAVRGSLVWVKNATGMGDPKTTFAPQHERIIHAVKGSPILFEREADVLRANRVDSDRHPTEKPTSLLKRLIEVTTAAGELVADPFGGVASTLVSAKELGRTYWGCELDATYHQAGMERLANATLPGQ